MQILWAATVSVNCRIIMHIYRCKQLRKGIMREWTRRLEWLNGLIAVKEKQLLLNRQQNAPPRLVAKPLCQQRFETFTSIVSRWCKRVQCCKLTKPDFADVFVATSSKRRSHSVIRFLVRPSMRSTTPQVAPACHYCWFTIQRALSDQSFAFKRNKIQQNTYSVFLYLLIILRMNFRQFRPISVMYGWT